MTHSYSNPSEHVDTSGVESGVSKGEILDKNGFTIRVPISDRECIYKCLHNCINLAGLDKNQVESCLLYTSPSPRDATLSRMPSSA